MCVCVRLGVCVCVCGWVCVCVVLGQVPQVQSSALGVFFVFLNRNFILYQVNLTGGRHFK